MNFPTPELANVVTAVQADLLVGIIRPSPDEVARALTQMLSTLDSDALEASLRLINLFLRRLDSNGIGIIGGMKKMSTLFEEAGLVDALWRICDHDSEESDIAELAADILDDYYEQEEEEDADESLLQPAYSLGGGQFQFQSPALAVPEGGFNFGSAAPPHPPQQQHQPVPPMGRGRGRGRGQVVPAWLK